MPNDDDFREYQKVISNWASPAQLRRLAGWITAEKLADLLEEIGSPGQAMEAVRALKKQIEARKRRVWLWGSLTDFLRYVTFLSGALAALHLIWSGGLDWLRALFGGVQ